MVKKFKELKRVYIPYTNMYEPITDDDKISLEKSIRKFWIQLISSLILFIVSLPIMCILIYVLFIGNDIWLINDTIQVLVFPFSFLIAFMTPFIFYHSIKKVRNGKKILESKKINVIRGVIERVFFRQYNSYFYIADDAQRFDLAEVENSEIDCAPGLFVEIRFNPYSIKRIDDNLYDVNFIYEQKYLDAIKKYETLLLEAQEELNNTNPREKEIIDDINERIDWIKIFIKHITEKLSELPKKINYPIKRKTNAIVKITLLTMMFGLALGLLGIILLVLSVNGMTIVSNSAAVCFMVIGVIIASLAEYVS